MLNPLEKLCTYDPRNPWHTPLDEESPAPREKGCACDACFYGRDSMALEIIRLTEALERIKLTTPEEHMACLDRLIAIETLEGR